MMMPSKWHARALLFFSVVALVAISSGCLRAGSPVMLDGAEIREYEGERLSSVNDFVENSILGPQYISNQTYLLRVTGMVEKEKLYTYDKVIGGHQNYEKAVTLNCVEGWSVRILWQGVLVRDLLNEAGMMPGAKVVIFRAQDGYSTSFPLEYIMDNDIIIAHKMNGVTLPPERGFPFQLVAESKWGYKWIKWITEIEVSDDEDYRGYWESRGYSNGGGLNGSFLGNG